jgi:putative phosphoribosyl transferase
MSAALFENEVAIKLGDCVLMGNLFVPEQSKKIVIFAHGSGSSRFSPRNHYVAQALNKQGFSTLLFDLLTNEEESIDEYSREFRFNINLLADRLVAVTKWVTRKIGPDVNIGYFGSSTGAAAALVAGAKCTDVVKAIVSRGGRPDLAGQSLAIVQAPTLLIVGGFDETVIDLNNAAMTQMSVPTQLAIVPEATHLFEEPNALDQVIHLAISWFEKYL